MIQNKRRKKKKKRKRKKRYKNSILCLLYTPGE